MRSGIPHATYRLQLNKNFRFVDVQKVVPYLHALGISHIYPSPYLRARPGSMHGYDILNHGELNPELGSAEDFTALTDSLASHDMAQLFDMVPNHMGILGGNVWWEDILENGPSSRYAEYFDIDWYSSLKIELHEKVLLPILGSPYGEALEAGELKLSYAQGCFRVHYYDNSFPIAVDTTEQILAHRLNELESDAGMPPDALLEYKSILTAVRNLPPRNDAAKERTEERMREKEVISRRLAAVLDEYPQIQSAVDATIAEFNGKARDSDSFNLLDALLNAQAYRLSYFRVAADEINYRRFFDINELAALNIERPEVFADTHRLLFELFTQGVVTAVRIDHVDGLYDPKEYLRALRSEFNARCPGKSDLFLLVEKIAAPKEPLRSDWGADGTTGYDFMSQANGVFVDQQNAKAFNRTYSRWSNGKPPFEEVAYQSKQQIQFLAMSAELHVLAQRLDRISELNRRTRDFTLNVLMNALRDVIACFPVYRSYIDESGISPEDLRLIEDAISRARSRNPAVHESVFAFIRDTLLLEAPETATEAYRQAQLAFARKFQQVTAPVTAKGVEDTAFYLFHRLISLNEVGSSPEAFGTSLQEFHLSMRKRQLDMSRSLSATSTHDTKRGEDTRARLNVLSEMPAEFSARLRRWERMNRRYLTDREGRSLPDRNTLYLFYQTLIGSWPIEGIAKSPDAFIERIQEYMQKAIHEAKEFTSWINPNQRYEDAIRAYVGGVLSSENQAFHEDMAAFLPKIIHFGLFNSLSQLALKLCCPGIPDIYQGCELWDFSLVDPDNRRPVDFGWRMDQFAALQQRFAAADRDEWAARASELVAHKQNGLVKLYALWRMLAARRQFETLFTSGDYTEVAASGTRARNVISFIRCDENASCLVAVPRFLAGLLSDEHQAPTGETIWSDTWLEMPKEPRERLDGRKLRNIFTGRVMTGKSQLSASEIFREFPIAVLTEE